jgi:DNA invertase Pin-like site-specific DNA recombinase
VTGAEKLPSMCSGGNNTPESGLRVSTAGIDVARLGPLGANHHGNGKTALGAHVGQRPLRPTSGTIAPPAPASGARVLGYASADADADGAEHLHEDFRLQKKAIISECDHRGLILLRVVHERDVPQGRALDRPGLGYALGRIAAGEVDGLVVSEFYRVAHSVPQLGEVLEWLSHHGARIVVVAAGVDTGEDAGRLTAQTIIQVSRSERQRLVERTRKGMRAARRNGPRSVSDYPELMERVGGMRAAGMTLQAIADQLNAERIPTVRGGAKWRPSSVQAAVGYQRRAARQASGLRGSFG